ncbi:MAG: diguanylate cyclase [Bacteroidetes bacterium]|nr:diguanylate cyclase [Bacteroidota bacterium]
MIATKILKILILLIIFPQCGCYHNKKSDKSEKMINYRYHVEQAVKLPAINSEWDKRFWEDAETISLRNYMGSRPVHFPETNAMLKYDDNHIYVIFKVKDQYVKAIAKGINGKVWQDSCVEFFFIPGTDISRGYFNFELNCKGIFLFEYHTNNGSKTGFVDKEDYSKIVVSHSLDIDVEQEVIEPVTWTVEYCLPFSILEHYMEVDKPVPGTLWRANFYKCADKTSQPHWLTWAPVDYHKPKFHLPQFFGWLEFR